MTAAPAASRGAYRVLAWSGAVAILVLSLIPPLAPVPETPLGTDKLVHAAAYAGLMFLFARAYPRPVWLLAASLLTGYGAVIELLQQIAPERFASVADALANLIGISIMLAVLYRGERVSAGTPPV